MKKRIGKNLVRNWDLVEGPGLMGSVYRLKGHIELNRVHWAKKSSTELIGLRRDYMGSIMKNRLGLLGLQRTYWLKRVLWAPKSTLGLKGLNENALRALKRAH